MENFEKIARSACYVLCALAFVGLVAHRYFPQPVASSSVGLSELCRGECCPCDAVDAHVVAKWLERSGNAALACNGRWRYFQVIDKGDTVFLFVGDEIGELGDAPASIGELEGDE